MCARRDAVDEVTTAAQCLTKACEGKIDRVLREVFEHVLDEPLPPDLRHLMSRLK